MDIAVQLWNDKYGRPWFAIFIEGKKAYEAGPLNTLSNNWRFEIEDLRKRA